jgi:hypothetical protein
VKPNSATPTSRRRSRRPRADVVVSGTGIIARYGRVAAMAERAAEYVRMSTEHQRYSTENQSDVIRRYAAARGIEIVRTYADEGRAACVLQVVTPSPDSSPM